MPSDGARQDGHRTLREDFDHIEVRITSGGSVRFPLPEWYLNLAGRVSVMTPYSTNIVTNKQAGSIAPFSHSGRLVARHYAWPEEMEYNDVRHEYLHPDKLRVKPWGEDARIYRVVVEDEREEDR